MRFLHVMRSVNPEGGGPIEALVQSEPAWCRRGHGREIASLDLPSDPWVAACPIPTHPLGSAVVRRLARLLPWLRYGFTPHLVPWLRRHVAGYDAVVVNGLWNYADWAARRVLPGAGRPYFVFTHGMLDPWFRAAYPLKHQAKQLSWWLCEGPLLHGARAVLFTSAAERAGAEHAFRPYRFASRISGYGTADPPPACANQSVAFAAAVPGLGDRPYLLFLSRLHPKKGCDLLLDAFATIAVSAPTLQLVLAGPDADDLRPRLQQLARAGGIADRVHWPGMLRGPAKWGAFYGCEAFVLPSHGENFGMAVVEAMACGKPVLISDRVNIAPDIARDGAGLAEPDTPEGARRLLSRFLELAAHRRAEMGQSARACFERHFSVEAVADDALALLGAGLPQ